MKRMIALVSLTILLAGCSTRNQPPANQAAPGPGQAANQTQRVQQTNPQPKYDQSSQATANRLVQLASRVKGVQHATAVVLGKYAVVGITVDGHLDRPQVGVIKYSTAEALKEDPQGAAAVVTANPAIVQRLQEMSDDIRNGRPIAGFAEELADIVGRIIPQTPRNVEKRERPESQTNQQRMNKAGTPPQPGPKP